MSNSLLEPLDNIIQIEIENIVGKEATVGGEIVEKLDKFDQQVRNYYLSLESPRLRVFNEFMSLFCLLIISIGFEIPLFTPKFKRNTPVQQVLDASASGSYRNLKVAYNLLLGGYVSEMHAIMRMVEQWLECAVIIEGNPSVAEHILKNGVYKLPNNVLQRAIKSSQDLETLYTGMKKTFGKLSERAHVTKTSFDLSKITGTEGPFIKTGIISDQVFHKDAGGLAHMAGNVLNIYLRHFKAVPTNWAKKYNEVKNDLIKTSVISPKKD